MTKSDEEFLPPEILVKAVRSDNEHAWRVDDIPAVIEAARASNLLNVGGQLQFLLPGICECYWVSVDLGNSVPKNLSWKERVELAAEVTQKAYAALRRSKDFLAEGRSAFEPYFLEFEKAGGKPEDVMCFVWYVERRRFMPRWISNLFQP